MTRLEFENKLNEKSIPYNFHQALSGSQYVTINGNKYRLSDHYQPSHYQVRNYTDVNSYEEILNLVSELERPISRENFIMIYMQGNTYKGHELTQQGDYIHNGFGLFIDVKCAANNLYYQLIDKNYRN